MLTTILNQSGGSTGGKGKKYVAAVWTPVNNTLNSVTVTAKYYNGSAWVNVL